MDGDILGTAILPMTLCSNEDLLTSKQIRILKPYSIHEGLTDSRLVLSVGILLMLMGHELSHHHGDGDVCANGGGGGAGCLLALFPSVFINKTNF